MGIVPLRPSGSTYRNERTLALDAGYMEGFIIFVIWGAIALISFIIKRRQEKTESWDEGWENDESVPPTQEKPFQPRPQQPKRPESRPTPTPARTQRREAPQRPLTPAAPNAAEQARELIEQAIRRQQGAAKAPAPVTRTATAQPAMLSYSDEVSQRLVQAEASGRLAPAPIGMAEMKLEIADTSTATSRGRAKMYKMGLNTRSGWRRSIVAREVLDRPRCFDT